MSRRRFRSSWVLAAVVAASVAVGTAGVAVAGASPVQPDNRPTVVPGAVNGRLPDGALSTVDPHCRIAGDAAFSMRSMLSAARAQGIGLEPEECYRDFEGQMVMRYLWCLVGRCGMAAVPGTSDHGWGKAVDLRDQTGELTFASPGYAWLRTNAARFGFNMPASLASTEPWHWEWVGDGGTLFPGQPMAPPANPPSSSREQTWWLAGGPFALGAATGPEHPDPLGQGTVVPYEHGAIYYRNGAAPRAVVGGIWGRYSGAGTVTGPLGYPTSDELMAKDRLGRFSTFDHGRIVWSQATGARVLTAGPVLDRWIALGGEASTLGYPTADGPTLVRGGAQASFEHGTLYRSETTGIHAVGGTMDAAYRAAGGPAGVLGFPTGDVRFVPGIALQVFEHGMVVATPTAAHAISAGPLLDLYLLLGGPEGAVGPPIGPVINADGVSELPGSGANLRVDAAGGTSALVRPSGSIVGATSVVTAEAWVAGLYRKLLGSPADPGGVAHWSGLLRAGVSPTFVSTAVATSPEARLGQIDGLYLAAFGRHVDAGGAAYWTSRLAGGLPWWALEAAVYGSPEWYRTHGGNDAAYVAALYPAILGRPADSGGHAYWTAQLSRGVQPTTLTVLLVSSPEHRRQMVDAAFRRVLGRPVDAGGASFWLAWLAEHGNDPAPLGAALAATVEGVFAAG